MPPFSPRTQGTIIPSVISMLLSVIFHSSLLISIDSHLRAPRELTVTLRNVASLNVRVSDHVLSVNVLVVT